MSAPGQPPHTARRCASRAARHLALALLTAFLFIAGRANAQLSVTVNVGPPALPVYEQPAIPTPGYLWMPGYWAYGPDGYFWVPGTWVEPPQPGLVWTPGYWGWSNGIFAWNAGYWGAQIGYYGGINYGFGYPGHGYYGGYWQNNQFFYNRSVTNITNTTNITNVYTKTVVNNVTVNNVSYNGGPGGVVEHPTAQEQAAAHQPHQPATSAQTAHINSAASQHDLLASVNQGRPQIAATPKPGAFSGPGIVKARGAPTPQEHAPAVAHSEAPKAVPPRPAQPAHHEAAPPAAHAVTPPAHPTHPPEQERAHEAPPERRPEETPK
jgi:WXXGXW repeat (2 copies)